MDLCLGSALPSKLICSRLLAYFLSHSIDPSIDSNARAAEREAEGQARLKSLGRHLGTSLALYELSYLALPWHQLANIKAAQIAPPPLLFLPPPPATDTNHYIFTSDFTTCSNRSTPQPKTDAMQFSILFIAAVVAIFASAEVNAECCSLSLGESGTLCQCSSSPCPAGWNIVKHC